MLTLLAIDDQEPVLDTLRHHLTAQGFSVLAATSGATGLALSNQHAIDGALVDVHMPGLNGIDVCRELRSRAQQAGRDLPVWLMTGACTSELRRLAEAAGALTIFAKPFNITELGRELKSRLDSAPPTVAIWPPED